MAKSSPKNSWFTRIQLGLQRCIKFIVQHKTTILFFGILAIVLLTSSIHEAYPDEFDNIAGGNFINHGVLPYSGFFTHHSPFAYFFAAVLLWFSGVSFIKFRIVLALFYLLFHAALYLYFKKRFTDSKAVVIASWSFFIALISTHMWGHMLLADSLAALLLTPAYAVLFLHIWQKKPLRLFDVGLIATLFSLALLTSITYIFAATIGYVFLLLMFIQQIKWQVRTKEFGKMLLICAAPYITFVLYLLLTRSANDFYYQSVYFNKEYYVGGEAGNPIRYAITIFAIFLENFRGILTQIKDPNFSNPFAITLAISNVVCLALLAIQKRWMNATLLLGLMVYVNVRSSPLTTDVTDYQAAAYQYLSLFNGLFSLHILWDGIRTETEKNKIFAYQVLLVLLSIFYFFFSVSMFNNWFEKVYDKYMGVAPLIYDRPQLAPLVNTLVKPGEYYYIGPFAFEEHLYVRDRKLASKYFITIPAMDKSEKIQTELIADLKQNKPPLLIFDNDYVVFSSFPGKFLEPLFLEDYTTLERLKAERPDINYEEKSFSSYELGSDFYIHKDAIEEMLTRFRANQLIK